MSVLSVGEQCNFRLKSKIEPARLDVVYIDTEKKCVVFCMDLEKTENHIHKTDILSFCLNSRISDGNRRTEIMTWQNNEYTQIEFGLSQVAKSIVCQNDENFKKNIARRITWTCGNQVLNAQEQLFEYDKKLILKLPSEFCVRLMICFYTITYSFFV